MESNNEQYMEEKQNEVISYKEWLITLLISSIPIIGIIMIFVWAFGGNTSESKSNYCKAQLTFMLIALVLSILIIMTMGGILLNINNSIM